MFTALDQLCIFLQHIDWHSVSDRVQSVIRNKSLLKFNSLISVINIAHTHSFYGFLADRTIGRAFGTVSRLSVCLSSVCLSSVTFCIVAKWCVLEKKCLKKWIGNQGQKFHFLGRRHISTSGFAATATKTAVFALFLPVQPSNRY